MDICEKYNLNAEIVIVEWNPSKNKPLLKDVLNWSKYSKKVSIRFVEVTENIHRKIPNSEKMSFFEFLAKNVGIRRARGEYILSTNADILFSEELIEFIARKQLSKENFYRVDRYDLYKSIPLNISTQKQLKFSEAHIYERKSINGRVFYKDSQFFRFRRLINYTIMNFRIRLKIIIISHKKLYSQKTLNDKASMKNLSINYKRVINFAKKIPSSIIETFRAYLSAPGVKRKKVTVDEQMGIHTHAAGDFFLMTKQYWDKLRGYPELNTHAYIDGYICFMAVALGLHQTVLQSPLKIYHQNHHYMDSNNRIVTDFNRYQEDAKKILNSKQPIIFNTEDWGLGNESLQEFQIE